MKCNRKNKMSKGGKLKKYKKGGKLKDACWSGYEAIGQKTKGGKKVPNCVPKRKS